MKAIILAMIFGTVLFSTLGASAVEAMKDKVNARHVQIEQAVK